MTRQWIKVAGLLLAISSGAYGAEVVDQITLVRARSQDTTDALRNPDPDNLRASFGDKLVLGLAARGPYEIAINSVQSKKYQRLVDLKKLHSNIVRYYPETLFEEDLSKKMETVEKEINIFDN